MVTLTFFPIIYNFYLSFFQKHAFLDTKKFIFFSNYSYLLKNAEFWTSFKNGLIYSISTIVLQIILGLLCALILNEKVKGRNFFRGALLFPYLIPTVVVVILWKWLLNSSYGLVNYILDLLHITSNPIVWFSRENIMFTLIMVSVWQFFPFVLITVMARLQTIPEDLYNAARTDGAPAISRFLHITLPQLKNVLFTVILLRTIWMFTKFDIVWLLAGKESVGKYVQTLPVYTFRKTFAYLEAGIGAALSVVMLIILFTGAVVYLRVLVRNEEN
jgi:multiple sugar transport system permease protein